MIRQITDEVLVSLIAGGIPMSAILGFYDMKKADTIAQSMVPHDIIMNCSIGFLLFYAALIVFNRNFYSHIDKIDSLLLKIQSIVKKVSDSLQGLIRTIAGAILIFSMYISFFTDLDKSHKYITTGILVFIFFVFISAVASLMVERFENK